MSLSLPRQVLSWKSVIPRRSSNITVRTLSKEVHDNNSSEEVAKPYDIIIAGGGLVGTALACSIGKNKTLADKSVLLLEGRSKFKGFKGGEYSNRVSAISHASVKLMKGIGAWDNILSNRYKSVKQIQVWDANSDALITFNHDNFADDVAYIVENDLIQDSVYQELAKCNNVEVKNMSKIACVKLPKDGAAKSTVFLKDGQVLKCDLLIGADGFNSVVRKQMNINTYTTGYNQYGLVATLELCEASDNSVAWQRFIPTGPVALLPLNDTISSLVWSTTPSHAKKLQSLKPDEFVDALNEAFLKVYPKDSMVTNALNMIDSFMGSSTRAMRQYPPRVKNVLGGSRAVFPLGFLHASSYIDEGVAIIGDAAHRIHPLAGQGVNLGFGDVTCLTELLAESVYAGFKLGEKRSLVNYEMERLMKNVPIMVGVHGLHNLYNTTFSPVVLLRSLGLQITQNIPPLKKMFMERAMG